ncbi:MAG TPA: glycosyltransferase [Planctomycetaceae bacterium]|nr:glycosyltransferase [Planctomycetaceae bacterium]
MKTAELFHACEKRKRAILKNGPAWLARYRAMVEHWGNDAGIDPENLRVAIDADIQQVSTLQPRFVSPRPLVNEASFPACPVSPSVGFLSTSYINIGGTESFHRTLIPRLNQSINIKGFVAAHAGGGDPSLLGVPYDTGLLAARNLAAEVDVLVTWGVQNLAEILPVDRPRIISVHHADRSSVWSESVTLEQIDLIDAIVCVNPDVADSICLCGTETHYIPNAIDLDRIRPSIHAETIRKRHGISDASKVVLFGHRMSPEKRPILACDVARELPDGWVMVIAGDGSESVAVERAAAASAKLIYVGATVSLADWLATADCFLSLSTFEGFGLSIGEAMLADVPTVSTPTGIAPGHAITLPSFSSAAQWAAAIVNSDSWVQPASFAEKFTVERFVASWANLISSVCKK